MTQKILFGQVRKNGYGQEFQVLKVEGRWITVRQMFGDQQVYVDHERIVVRWDVVTGEKVMVQEVAKERGTESESSGQPVQGSLMQT